jgi:predicted ATP-dependent serine protease
MEERLREASRLGFSTAILSARSQQGARHLDLDIVEVDDVREALTRLGVYAADR